MDYDVRFVRFDVNMSQNSHKLLGRAKELHLHSNHCSLSVPPTHDICSLSKNYYSENIQLEKPQMAWV